MYYRAVWKYFLDVNIFNIAFSVVFALFLGALWGIIVFCSFGTLVGLIGFQTFKRNEYYTYYNLGFKKASLIKRIWGMNLLVSVILYLIVK